MTAGMTTHEPTREVAEERRERIWWPLIRWGHLIYLTVPALTPTFNPHSGWVGWALYVGTLLVFLPLYALEMLRNQNTRWCFTIPVVLLGAVTTPFNPGMGVLFVYAAAAIGVSERRTVALRAFVGLTVLAAAFLLVSVVPMPYRTWVLPNVLFIWIVGMVQVDAAARDRHAADLRVANAHIDHLARVAERERIARDLHDLLGHSLTAMIVRAQLVHGLVTTDPRRAAEESAEIESTAREALNAVRGAVRGWRLATLDDELASARGVLDSANIRLDVHRDPEVTLVGSAEHELALAAREALTNVARHAGASNCQVRVTPLDEDLRLVVADDGVGGAVGEGNGLRGVRERVAALGGWVKLDGSGGTTLTVSLPRQVAS